MKPTIILLAKEPLLASWRECLLRPHADGSLLSPGEVTCTEVGAIVPELLNGDGEHQLLVCVLSPTVRLGLAAIRADFPKLAIAVAENPQSRFGDFGAGWPAELGTLVDYPIVMDMAAREGTSLCRAVERFLTSGLLAPTLAEWRSLDSAERKVRYPRIPVPA